MENLMDFAMLKIACGSLEATYNSKSVAVRLLGLALFPFTLCLLAPLWLPLLVIGAVGYVIEDTIKGT